MMTWLVWRQRRGEVLGVALMLVIVAAVGIPMGLHLHQVAATYNADNCAGANPGIGCSAASDAYNSVSRLLSGILPWISFLPGLLGVFVGAPLISRELEEGTWRLAWSQSVTRWRWLRAQLSGAGLVVLAGSVVLTGIFMWWLIPMDDINGRFVNNGFDTYGLVPVGWSLLAFAIGVLAGVLLRRVVPAMAATLGTYLAIRLPVEYLIRPHYLPAVTLWGTPPGYSLPPGDWWLSQQAVAPHSHRVLSANEFDQLQHLARSASGGLHSSSENAAQLVQGIDHYMSTHGYTQVFTYQPAGRFWAFQGIEAGICLLLASVALFVASRLVLRYRN
jgi:hypothetical protein